MGVRLMYYDLRCGGRVIERLGLSELRQELTNLVEGGAGYVEVAVTGELPVVRVKPKKRVTSRTT